MTDQKSTVEEDLADFYINPAKDTDSLCQRVDAEAPIVRDPKGTWLVGSHALANEVARNQTAVWHRRNPTRNVADLRPLLRFRYFNMNAREGADHDRFRDLVSQAFTARASQA